jgi:hypothetical protein
MKKMQQILLLQRPALGKFYCKIHDENLKFLSKNLNLHGRYDFSTGNPGCFLFKHYRYVYKKALDFHVRYLTIKLIYRYFFFVQERTEEKKAGGTGRCRHRVSSGE